MESKDYIYIDCFEGKTKTNQKKIYLADIFKFRVGDFVRVKSSFKDQTDWFAYIVGFISIFDGGIGVLGNWSMDWREAKSSTQKPDFNLYGMNGYTVSDKRWYTDKNFSWNDDTLKTIGYMELNSTMTKEGVMNQLIIDSFPKTKDAVLIEKWFGKEFSQNNLIGILVKGKEKTLLSEALRLEEESKKKSS